MLALVDLHPLEMDLVEYAYDRDDGEHVATTQPLALVEWWLRPVLARMRIGEHRRFGYDDQGDACDHFGCGAPTHYRVNVTLIDIAPMHDRLPDGLSLTARDHDVIVRQRGVRAGLHLPYPVERIVRVWYDRARAQVEIDVSASCGEPHTATFTVAQLVARLDDARGQYARALARDPELDLARLHLARAQARAGHLDDARATFAPVLARDPVGALARALDDRVLARLWPAPTAAAPLDQITIDASGRSSRCRPARAGCATSWPRARSRSSIARPARCATFCRWSHSTVAIAITAPRPAPRSPRSASRRASTERRC